MKYEFRIIRERVDNADTGKRLAIGDIIATEDKNRVEFAITHKLAELYSATDGKKRPGNRIIVYASYLAPFGGIETATYELAKMYGRKKNMKLVVKFADPMALLKISDYVDVELDNGQDLEFESSDILILVNFDTASILPRVKKWPRKIYQQNHAVWDQLPNLHFKELITHKDKIDAVLSVSNESKRGLIKRYGIDSVVVPNIITAPSKTITFGFFSRSSSEKGFETIMPAVKKFKEYGKPFMFVISTNVTNESRNMLLNMKNDPNICILNRGIDNRGLIHSLDYLWQLSSTESMGLSAYEALLSGVPVIGSRIPCFEEIIKPGVNGYLVKQDLSDLPVKEIFENKMKQPLKPLIDVKKLKETEVLWEKVFNGEY